MTYKFYYEQTLIYVGSATTDPTLVGSVVAELAIQLQSTDTVADVRRDLVSFFSDHKLNLDVTLSFLLTIKQDPKLIQQLGEILYPIFQAELPAVHQVLHLIAVAGIEISHANLRCYGRMMILKDQLVLRTTDVLFSKSEYEFLLRLLVTHPTVENVNRQQITCSYCLLDTGMNEKGFFLVSPKRNVYYYFMTLNFEYTGVIEIQKITWNSAHKGSITCYTFDDPNDIIDPDMICLPKESDWQETLTRQITVRRLDLAKFNTRMYDLVFQIGKDEYLNLYTCYSHWLLK